MRTFVSSLGVILLLAATAHAQDFEAAGKHFSAAQDAFALKHYKIAATEFQQAFDITKDPILLFNIGESWHKAGEGKKAVAAYKEYVRLQPVAQDKAEVSKRIKTITAKKYKLPSQSAPGDDPAPAVAVAPTPPLSPVVTPPPQPPVALKSPFDDKPPPAPAPEPVKTEPPAPAPAPTLAVIGDKPASKMKIVAWVGVAATVAVLTAGAIMGLAAQSRADEINRRFNFVDQNGQPRKFDATQQKDYNDLKAEGELYNGLGIGFFSAAGALAVVTTVLFVVDYKNGKREAQKRAFNFTPTFGKDAAGITAGWRF